MCIANHLTWPQRNHPFLRVSPKRMAKVMNDLVEVQVLNFEVGFTETWVREHGLLKGLCN